MARKISSIREKLKIIVRESHKMGFEHIFFRSAFSQVIGKKYCWPTLDSFLNGKSQMSVSKFESLCSLLGIRNEFTKKGLGHPYIKLVSLNAEHQSNIVYPNEIKHIYHIEIMQRKF